jgi:hypothetical protein
MITCALVVSIPARLSMLGVPTYVGAIAAIAAVAGVYGLCSYSRRRSHLPALGRTSRQIFVTQRGEMHMEKPQDRQPDITLTDADGNLASLDVKLHEKGGRVEKATSEVLVRLLANSSSVSSLGELWGRVAFDPAKTPEKKADLAAQQLTLLRELSAAKIDAQLFDLMLSNELDRNLKRQFATWFFWATVAFTIVSYLVVILNSPLNWRINQIAITALIIETPLQFIGLLYIIARNLFPQGAIGAAPSRERTSRRLTPAPARSPGAG